MKSLVFSIVTLSWLIPLRFLPHEPPEKLNYPVISSISVTSEMSEFLPELPENQFRIIYSKKRKSTEGWSIYSIKPDGTDEKILIPSSSGMGEYNPTVSKDGNFFIFNTYRYGGWKLATYDPMSGEVNRVPQGSSYFTNASFSPNGEKIVYEKSMNRATHICIANKNGSNEIILTSSFGQNESRIPVWSQNGNSIIFYSEKSGVNDIYSIDIESRNVKNLTNNKEGNDFAPSISPDGKQIAFFSDRNGYLDLYKMDADGNNQMLLTKSIQNDQNEYNYYRDNNIYWKFKNCWSPDGKHIVFSNVTKDNIDLFTIDNNSLEIKNITNSPNSEYTPFWSALK